MKGSSRRIAAVMSMALLFGVLSSVFKGNDAGARDAIGNLSAPWLIVPLVAAWYASQGRPLRGALIGLATTMAAIVGFYASNAFVLDLGPHTTITDLGLTLSPGFLWARYGLISGVVFGAIGAWSRQRSRATLGLIIAVLLMLEPLAWIAYYGARHVSLGSAAANTVVFVVEASAGLALALATWWRVSRQ